MFTKEKEHGAKQPFVVGITSSPGVKGNTSTLVRVVLSAAQEAGARVEEIDLARRHLEYCRGCMACMGTGHCSIPDDLEEIRGLLLESDGIVIGSPTYALAPNAIMKNFLDRICMHTIYSSNMDGKYFVGVSTAGGFGAKRVARSLTTLSDGVFSRARRSGTLGILRDWHRVEDVPGALDRARALGWKLVRDIKTQKPYRYQNLISRAIFRLIRRVFVKNVLQNKQDKMKAIFEFWVSQGFISAT